MELLQSSIDDSEDTVKEFDKLIKPHKLNSNFIINMGSNNVKVKNYKCPLNSKIKELEDVALNELNKITRIIENNKDFRDEDSNYFYVNSNCIGCGICSKVCLFTKDIYS